jgi:hypothetical protein
MLIPSRPINHNNYPFEIITCRRDIEFSAHIPHNNVLDQNRRGINPYQHPSGATYQRQTQPLKIKTPRKIIEEWVGEVITAGFQYCKEVKFMLSNGVLDKMILY